MSNTSCCSSPTPFRFFQVSSLLQRRDLMRSKPTFLLAVILVVFLAVEGLADTHFHALPATPSQSPHPRTVLVELFTSESASSCPPAAALLKQLYDTARLNDVTALTIHPHLNY